MCYVLPWSLNHHVVIPIFILTLRCLCVLQLLRRCIVDMSKPTIEGPLGQPPFERPSIAKAITNFVLYKFGHSAQRVCCNLQHVS